MLAQKNHLGASWAVLGALGRLLGGLGGVPESSGKVAEGFGKVLNGKYWFSLIFEAQGGHARQAWHGRARILGPPNIQKLNTEKPNTEH